MNYFLLHSDPRYVDSPEFLDWRGKIDPRNIRPESSHKIARRQILNIRPNPHMVFIHASLKEMHGSCNAL